MASLRSPMLGHPRLKGFDRELKTWMPGTRPGMTNLLHLTIAEQPELRRVARRFGQSEMAERVRGNQSAARRALQQSALNEIWLDDVPHPIPPPPPSPPHPPP